MDKRSSSPEKPAPFSEEAPETSVASDAAAAPAPAQGGRSDDQDNNGQAHDDVDEEAIAALYNDFAELQAKTTTEIPAGRSDDDNVVLPRPGAYACAGTTNGEEAGTATTNTAPTTDRTNHTVQVPAGNGNGTPATHQDHGLAVAHAVEDGGVSPTDVAALPRATEEVPASTTSSTLREKHWVTAFASKPFTGFAILVIVIIVTVPMVVTMRSKKNCEATMSPTISSSSVDDPIAATRDLIIGLLPNYTVQTILPSSGSLGLSQQEPSTPQAQALAWILEDPYLETYLPNTPDGLAEDTDRLDDPNLQRFFHRFALATFFFATNGPNWDRHTHWLSYDHHECLWFAQNEFTPDLSRPEDQFVHMKDYHLLVNRNPCELPETNGTVNSAAIHDEAVYKHLWLQTNHLEGTLPVELFWLKSLRSIALHVNENLRGSIPSQIGQLSELEAWSSAMCGMTGTLPTELGTLTQLHLLGSFQNQHTGALPSELGLLHRTLISIVLDVNPLSGTIPEELYELTQMRSFTLDTNNMVGTLSTRVGQLRSIWDLQLYQSHFEGTIPSEIGNLKSLKRLLLFDSNFSGTICTEIGALSDRLMVFEAYGNRFSGPIPSELGLLNGISEILLQENDLSGSIPKELINLQEKLLAWNVSGNENLVLLEGELDSEGNELDLCFVNTSRFEMGCPPFLNLSISCWHCDCTCPNTSGDTQLPNITLP